MHQTSIDGKMEVDRGEIKLTIDNNIFKRVLVSPMDDDGNNVLYYSVYHDDGDEIFPFLVSLADMMDRLFGVCDKHQRQRVEHNGFLRWKSRPSIPGPCWIFLQGGNGKKNLTFL